MSCSRQVGGGAGLRASGGVLSSMRAGWSSEQGCAHHAVLATLYRPCSNAPPPCCRWNHAVGAAAAAGVQRRVQQHGHGAAAQGAGAAGNGVLQLGAGPQPRAGARCAALPSCFGGPPPPVGTRRGAGHAAWGVAGLETWGANRSHVHVRTHCQQPRACAGPAAAQPCHRVVRPLRCVQADVRTNLGDLWRAQGEAGRPSALACYTEVLRHDAGYAPAWRGLGDCHREAGDHAQAATCYQVRGAGRPGGPGEWGGVRQGWQHG